MTLSRRYALIVTLVGLGSSGAASAIDPTLQVVSGTSSAESRRPVALTSARYDVALRALVATTRAGNFVCNTSQTPGAGALRLRLDGVDYPVATSGLPGTLAAPIEYLPSSVTFALGLLGTVAPGQCASSHTTASSIGLRFPTQRRLPVAERVYFDLPTRAFQIRVAEPVLCESYVSQGAGSGVTILLNDANAPVFNAATAKLLPGFVSAEYALNGFELLPLAQGGGNGPRVQCSVPASTVVATPGGGGGNTIFASGFEAGGTTSQPSDVTVTLAGVGEPSAGNNQTSVGALPSGTLQYTVRVANDGLVTASNVRVREYVTSAQAIAQAGQPQPAALLAGESGSNTCTPFGGAPACAAPGFPLSANIASLAPGAGYLYTLTRVVESGAVIGERGYLGYVATVDPDGTGPDANLTNNGAWLAANIISNQSPVIAPIGNQSMDEDGTPLVVAISVTDPEGDPIQTPQVSSNNPTLFPNGSLVVSGSSSPYQLTITPAPDKNGLATLTVTASDGNTTSLPRTFQVNVNAVNDPPTFALNVAGGELLVTNGQGGCTGTLCLGSAAGFVANLQPGPPTATDEAGQVVTPATETDFFGDARLPAGSCRAAAQNGVAPAQFFVDGLLPRVTQPTPGVYNLIAAVTRVEGVVECDIRVVDNGSPPASSAPQVLRIRYAEPNLPPTVSMIGNQSAVEDSPLVIPFSASDPESASLLFEVDSDNPSLFAGNDFFAIVETSPGNYSLTLTAEPDANSAMHGDASITLSVSDGVSSVPRTFAVNVAAVNDPPSFTLNVAGGELLVVDGQGACAGQSCLGSAANVIIDRQPGPPTATDESSQVVVPATELDQLGDARLPSGACRAADQDGVAPAQFFIDGLLPRVTQPSAGVYNLVVSLTRTAGAVDCDVTVVDDGSPAATSAPQVVRVRYQPPS